jgi:hypothetical protein
MRYFKHAPLAFWAVFVLGLGLLVSVAIYVGKDNAPNINVYDPTYSQRDAAFSMVQRVSGMYPAVTANNLTQWAEETEYMARQNLDLYIENGGEEFDEVGLAWAKVAESAESLGVVDVTNNPLVLEKTAVLGQAAQNLIVKVDSYTTPGKGVSR